MPLGLGDLSHVITPPVSPVAGPMALNQGIEGAQQSIRMNAQVAEENANRQAQIAQDEAERASREAYQHAQQALEKARYDEIARANAAEEEQKHQTAMAQHIANAPKDPALLSQWIAQVKAEGGSVEPKPAPPLAPELAGLTRTGPMASPTAAVSGSAYKTPGTTGQLAVPIGGEEKASLDQFLGGKANEARTAIASSKTEEPGVVTRADQELGDGAYVIKDRHGKVLGEVNPKARYEENKGQLRMAVGGMALTARPEEQPLWKMLEQSPELMDSLLKIAGGNAQTAFTDLTTRITNPQFERQTKELDARQNTIAQGETRGFNQAVGIDRIARSIIQDTIKTLGIQKLNSDISRADRSIASVQSGTGLGDFTALINEQAASGARPTVAALTHALNSAGYKGKLDTWINMFKTGLDENGNPRGGRLSPELSDQTMILVLTLKKSLIEQRHQIGMQAQHQIETNYVLNQMAPKAAVKAYGKQGYDIATGTIQDIETPNQEPAGGPSSSSIRVSGHGSMADEVEAEIDALQGGSQ